MEVWNNQLLLTEGSWDDVQKAALSVRDELVSTLIRKRAVPCEHGIAYWSAVPRSTGSSALFYIQHAPVWIATGAFNWYTSPKKAELSVSRIKAGVSTRWRALRHLGDVHSGVLAFLVGRWRAVCVFWRHWAGSIAESHRARLEAERDITAERIGRLVCASQDSPLKFVTQLTEACTAISNSTNTTNKVTSPSSTTTTSSATSTTAKSDGLASPEDAFSQLQALLDKQLPTMSSTIPNVATRWWPVVGTAIVIVFELSGSWRSVVAWFQNSVVDTLQSFFHNWVVDPLLRIYMTIRHDPTNEVALVAKGSLASDMTSLERMVTDFARDINPGLSSADLEQVRVRAANGDLTPVMAVYEQQLGSPITSLVTGKLIRTLLIQVQKGKVDLEVALSGIDRLLQSQQLVFGLVAAIPALTVVWWFTKHFVAQVYRQLYGSEAANAETERQRVVTALSNLDAVAQQAPQQLRNIDVGLVFTHVALVRNALRSDTLGSRQLQKVLDRMLSHAVERDTPALLADLDRAYIRYLR